MGAYDLKVVIKKWEKGDLTTEQAIGQILQHLQTLAGRVGVLERRLNETRRKGETEIEPRREPPIT